MIAVSIVSHHHNQFVCELISKLGESKLISTIVVTENIKSEPEIIFNNKLKLVSNSSPLGFGKNHNNALDHINEDDHVLVLNPDVLFPFNIDATLQEALDFSIDKKGIFSPQQMDSNNNLIKNKRPYMNISTFIMRQLGINREADKYWIPGAFMLFTPGIFQELLFDEQFFMYCEDMDICKRANLAGYDVSFVNGSCPIIHDGQLKSKKDFIHFYFHLSSLIRYFKKWNNQR